jgi:hypothetical protein
MRVQPVVSHAAAGRRCLAEGLPWPGYLDARARPLTISKEATVTTEPPKPRTVKFTASALG